MSIHSRRLLRSDPRSFARYGAWFANAAWPSDTEVARVASYRLSFAVFNADLGAWAAKIKALDPAIRLYAYVCLSSTRSYEPTSAIAGAVAYNDAMANSWIATDTANAPINWGAYAGHYQTKVWDTAYQDAYLAHIATVLADPLWDGIWADNDLWTLSYYSTKLLAGTTTQAATDQKIRDGLDVLVSRAGALAKSRGKVLMPNYGDGKIAPARQAQHASFGGASTEEMFMAWPWSPPADPQAPLDTASMPPQIYQGNSWAEQVGNVRPSIINGAMTQIPATDARCPGLDRQVALYGYTSFLLGAKPGDGWSPMPSTYVQSVCPRFDFQSIDIGRPLAPYVMQGAVATRQFAHALVAVNPSLTSQTVTLPTGPSQTLAPKSGLLIAV